MKSGKSLGDRRKRREGGIQSQQVYEAVSNRVMGAYFGMICEIVDSGISNIGDMELAMDVGLVLSPPFSMMNKMGVKKAS